MEEMVVITVTITISSIDHNVCYTQRANYGCLEKLFRHFLTFETLSYNLSILFSEQFLSVGWGGVGFSLLFLF